MADRLVAGQAQLAAEAGGGVDRRRPGGRRRRYGDLMPWRTGMPQRVIPVGDGFEPPPAAALPRRGAGRRTCAMLFGDVKGFSRLHDDQLPGFIDVFLGCFAQVIERFLTLKGFTRYGLFVQDYGGPVGLRSYVGSYNLGEIDGYAGILALIAAAALATRWRAPGAWRWRVWYLVGGVGLLVALARNIPQAHAALKQGKWKRSAYGGVALAAGGGVIARSQLDREWDELALKRTAVKGMLGL